MVSATLRSDILALLLPRGAALGPRRTSTPDEIGSVHPALVLNGLPGDVSVPVRIVVSS